jgi:hypothetical protein
MWPPRSTLPRGVIVLPSYYISVTQHLLKAAFSLVRVLTRFADRPLVKSRFSFKRSLLTLYQNRALTGHLGS